MGLPHPYFGRVPLRVLCFRHFLLDSCRAISVAFFGSFFSLFCPTHCSFPSSPSFPLFWRAKSPLSLKGVVCYAILPPERRVSFLPHLRGFRTFSMRTPPSKHSLLMPPPSNGKNYLPPSFPSPPPPYPDCSPQSLFPVPTPLSPLTLPSFDPLVPVFPGFFFTGYSPLLHSDPSSPHLPTDDLLNFPLCAEIS